MASLSHIPGIGKTSLALLLAAGVQDVEALAKADVPELAQQLERANSLHKISKRTPGQAALAKWIAAARDLAAAHDLAAARDLAAVAPEPTVPTSIPVNYEQSPQVVSMLANAPFAIPLPARMLVENQLGVQSIPAAILLNRYSGDLDVRVEQRTPMNWQIKPAAPSNSILRILDAGHSRAEIDTSKMRSTDSLQDPLSQEESVQTPVENDRVSLIRSPRSSTNAGRDPLSRWYIRGVLHSHPLAILLGSGMTLLLMVLTPVAVISTTLLLLSAELPGSFSWVPKGLLAFPLALPVFGLAYLIWGLGCSCRICGQRLFVHRSHLKNSKAHHVPGLGHILPLCVQILLFRWFRCTHCGTPVRLKE